MKYFIVLVILVVAAAIVVGLVISGSPQENRERTFDAQRISDLQTLQSEIFNYWQTEDKLPSQLSDLQTTASQMDATIPTDPATMQPYQYNVQSSSTFTLCATFDLPSSQEQDISNVPTAPAATPTPAYPGTATNNDNWNHAAGPVCFPRTVPALTPTPTPPTP